MAKLLKTYQDLLENPNPVYLPFTDSDLASKIAQKVDAIIVLDDDPTGTQTIHDLPVLTEWSREAIEAELDRETPLFYILTNSRSLPSAKARLLGLEIAENIKHLSATKKKKCLIISRSDSTLRGHYPLEVDLLIDTLQPKKGVHFLVPSFFEGGRYTIGDVHYVREGDQLIPVGDTPFARDKAFGFRSSNLKDWVLEKYQGALDKSKIHSIPIEDLDDGSSEKLIAKINGFKSGDVCIINAFEYQHLKKALFCIFSTDVDPYFRSAASLVAALAGQSPKLLQPATMSLDADRGGLIVVGSYVPKSTEQLNHVLDHADVEGIEIDIPALINGNGPESKVLAEKIDDLIINGKDVLVYTSRGLVSSNSPDQNLKIGQTVSDFLTSVVSHLTRKPRYLIGKGGITSSDLATKGLKIKRAIVLGQMIPGVPVWEAGDASKFPGTPFIVFPGNVGDHTSLLQVIQKLSKPITP